MHAREESIRGAKWRKISKIPSFRRKHLFHKEIHRDVVDAEICFGMIARINSISMDRVLSVRIASNFLELKARIN